MKKLLLIGPDECFPFFQTIEDELRKTRETFCVKLTPTTSLEKQLFKFAPEDFSFLVLCDDRFSNLVRQSLIRALQDKGYDAISYQGPSARLGQGTRLAASSIIMNGATVEDGVEIGPCTLIGTNSYVGPNTRIAEAVTLQPFARLGSRVTIGPRVSIGSGVTINDGADVGHDSEIATPGVYTGLIEPRTYVHPKLGGPARIYRFGV